jgi:DNA-binding NtrC family response regulator
MELEKTFMSETRRILFIDDEELLLACFQRTLGPKFDLDVAAAPNQALEALTSRGPYAVVVSDMRMPGMNGIELISKIKQLSPHTVGLLLSGNAQSDETDEAVRNGTVYRVVQKPCPHEEMIKLLEESLAQFQDNIATDRALHALFARVRMA